MNNKEIIENFVDRVRRFASVHDLFVKGGKYIVALSGGADSVAMLLVMRLMAQELGLKVDAAHCNFHLRGDESMRDELFCKDLCQRLGVPFHVVHFDTQAYADLHHVSIEMAAATCATPISRIFARTSLPSTSVWLIIATTAWRLCSSILCVAPDCADFVASSPATPTSYVRSLR